MVPDPAFEEKLAELVPDEDGRSLIRLGIELTICADPTVGIAMDDPPKNMWYFFIPEAPPWSIPRMTAMYSFDDDNVYLHWVDHSTKLPTLA